MVEARENDSPRNGVGSRLVFHEHTVVKYQNVERTRLELMKTQLGHEIGRATSLFKTPSIVAHDAAAGSITFERMYGFGNLKQTLSSVRSPDRLIERVARSLAAIHNQLSLPDRYVIPLPDFGVDLQTRPVFVHGDFSTANIFYKEESDELAVIDWSPSDWLAQGLGTHGSRYVDLTILLQSVFTSRPFGLYPISDPVFLGQIFLEVYRHEIRDELRSEEFLCYFRALLALFLKNRRKEMGLRFIAYQLSIWQLQQFVRRFCHHATSTR